MSADERLLEPELVRDGRGSLCFSGLSLETIASEHQTPCYVYSAAAVRRAYREFTSAVEGTGSGESIVCVSVKANSNLSLLRILAREGSGFDVVSGGELARVIAAGGDPRRTVFAGVGKRDDEIRQALDASILLFNVESEPELRRIDAIARERGVRAPVALRVNPDVDARTHAHISTGKEEHKFGIPLDEAAAIYRDARELTGCQMLGVDCHIGSMISSLDSFGEAFTKLRGFVEAIRADAAELRYIDLGGGLGISYGPQPAPDVREFGRITRASFASLGLQTIFEPGRYIFGNAGVLLATVLYVKESPGRERAGKRFLIVDAAFNDLIRPVLYEAHHEIVPLRRSSSTPEVPYDVVGPICETGDCFAHDRVLPRLVAGDRIALLSAGAYGFVMSSTYNTRPLPAEVLIDEGTARVIKPRRRVEDLFDDELRLLGEQSEMGGT